MTSASAIYEGFVAHRRHATVEHAFRFPLFMMYVDLDELPTLFRRHWFWSATGPNVAWFRRADHLGDPERPLADSVRDLVDARLGFRPTGPIRLLTHFRYFGVGMNPISLFYCFGDSPERVEAIAADVTNTPWNERHVYVLDVRDAPPGEPMTPRCDKELHVSPFFDMDHEYRWRIGVPGDRIDVRIEARDATRLRFEADLRLTRFPLDGYRLARALTVYPAMTAQVIASIYWQALRLKLKGAPYVPHPAAVEATAANASHASGEQAP